MHTFGEDDCVEAEVPPAATLAVKADLKLAVADEELWVLMHLTQGWED